VTKREVRLALRIAAAFFALALVAIWVSAE
jgi:hypothetical protein